MTQMARWAGVGGQLAIVSVRRWSRARGLEDRGEGDPQRQRSERERAQQGEGWRIADELRQPAAQRRAGRRAQALHGDHRALADIDPPRAVQHPRHQARHGHALQPRAHAVQNLNRKDAPPGDHPRRDQAADRQGYESDEQDQPVALPLGHPHGHDRGQHHRPLRHHDGQRHQSRRVALVRL
jgi:hypothetical protein